MRPRLRLREWVLLALGLVLICGFTELGLWQVRRLAWKQDLIARVERRLHEAPSPAPGPDTWHLMHREADEYRRVQVRGRYAPDRQVRVQASTELGAGYWVVTPLLTEQGYWVLINRGYVPPTWQAPGPGAGLESPPTDVSGLLRLSEPGGGFLRRNNPAQHRWYSRDVAAIAVSVGLPAARVAPYFIDAAAVPEASRHDRASAPPAWPRPGLTVLSFSNNHLVYAITWFGLALMTLASLVYLLLLERRRLRLRLVGGRGAA